MIYGVGAGGGGGGGGGLAELVHCPAASCFTAQELLAEPNLHRRTGTYFTPPPCRDDEDRWREKVAVCTVHFTARAPRGGLPANSDRDSDGDAGFHYRYKR